MTGPLSAVSLLVPGAVLLMTQPPSDPVSLVSSAVVLVEPSSPLSSAPPDDDDDVDASSLLEPVSAGVLEDEPASSDVPPGGPELASLWPVASAAPVDEDVASVEAPAVRRVSVLPPTVPRLVSSIVLAPVVSSPWSSKHADASIPDARNRCSQPRFAASFIVGRACHARSGARNGATVGGRSPRRGAGFAGGVGVVTAVSVAFLTRVDLVEHHAEDVRVGLQQGGHGSLELAAGGLFAARHDDDAVDLRRQDQWIGDGQHR